jgi:Bacterial Ig domain
MQPGEVKPLYLNYAPVFAPVAGRGLHCSPGVEIIEKDTCPPTASNNLPPQKTGEAMFSCPVDGRLSADLRVLVKDPEGVALIFKVLPLYAPKHGRLILNPDGRVDYTPFRGYQGYDRFFYSASDGVNSIISEVLIGVGVTPTVAMMTPVFSVGAASVDPRFYTVVLPLIASPAALPCQVFRLNIRQGALDCDCNCLYSINCVDVRISKC